MLYNDLFFIVRDSAGFRPLGLKIPVKIPALLVSILLAAVSLPAAHATSFELDTSNSGGVCQNEFGGAWVQSTETCNIDAQNMLNFVTLKIDSGVTVAFIGYGMINQGNGILDNNGTIDLYSGGGLSDIGPIAAVNNYGSIIINSGGQLSGGGPINNNGTITVNSGGSYTVSGTDVNHGLIQVAGGSAIIEAGMLDNDAGGRISTSQEGTINNLGTINNNYGGTINNNSTSISNHGTITNAMGASIYNHAVFENYAMFDNGGSMDNTGAIQNQGGTINNSGTISNDRGGFINNNIYSPNFVNYAYGIINNTGTIANSGTFGNSAGFDNYGTFTNPGGVTNYNGGTIRNGQGGAISNPGSITDLCGSTFSESGGTLSGNQVVNACMSATATALSSSPNPSVYGGQVNITASISPAGAGGTVTFTIDGSAGPSSAISSGHASLLVSSLSVGTHNVTASYSGDANDKSSTSAILKQVVDQAPTSTALQSSQDPSTVGEPVTFNATVSPATATGTVTFENGTLALGTAALSGGSATLTTSSFAAGSYQVTAKFSGSGDFAQSTSNELNQTVDRIATATTLSASAGSAIMGQAITLTAKVSPAVHDGETVTFYNGTDVVGTGTTSSGTAAVNETLSTGHYAITAYYPGDANYTASTSAPVAVTVYSLLGEKQGVVQGLESLNASDHEDRHDLGQAAEAVQDSVDPSLWQADGIHLVVKTGHKVFDDEQQAVRHLEDIMGDRKESASFGASLQDAISVLVGVDRGLAQTAISDASGAPPGGDSPRDISHAQKFMSDAASDASHGHFADAIQDYSQAWELAEHANPGDHHSLDNDAGHHVHGTGH